MWEADPSRYQYPDVRYWSDVVFVEWQSQARSWGFDVRQLNYVFRFEIFNLDTKAVMQHILGGSDGSWPGIEVSMSDPGGLAMLGTPNGRGVAWLLATHQDQLGRRTVESIRVWSTGSDYHAYFKIVPLED